MFYSFVCLIDFCPHDVLTKKREKELKGNYSENMYQIVQIFYHTINRQTETKAISILGHSKEKKSEIPILVSKIKTKKIRTSHAEDEHSQIC